LLGRVSGAFRPGVTVPQVLSVGLGAALIAARGNDHRLLLVIVAAVVAIAVAFLISQPAMRRKVRAAQELAADAVSSK